MIRKKIVAREGLIIIALFILSVCIGSFIMRQILEKKYYSSSKPQTLYGELKGYKEQVVLPLRSFEKKVLLPVFLYLYGLYLVWRFVAWALKTVKENNK